MQAWTCSFSAAYECEDFVSTFNAEFSTAQGPIADCFQAAIFATKMDWIVSAFVANATQFLLSGDITDAGVRASFAASLSDG